LICGAASSLPYLVLLIPYFLFSLDQLLHHIKNYSTLSAEAQVAMQNSFEQVVLPKNEYLLTEGRVCRHLYFLQTGALRGYYSLDGKEITYWFGFENAFVTSVHSFITGAPAGENIQLLEGSVLWAISKDALTGLYEKHHEIERLVRIIYEIYYIKLQERFVNAQFRSATERYENLIQQSPHILERVPLGHIASYLGISQETLSRIRNR